MTLMSKDTEAPTSNEHLKNLERDAKRYRFVRQFGNPSYDPGFQAPDEPKTVEEFDATIDWAMVKAKFEQA